MIKQHKVPPSRKKGGKVKAGPDLKSKDSTHAQGKDSKSNTAKRAASTKAKLKRNIKKGEKKSSIAKKVGKVARAGRGGAVGAGLAIGSEAGKAVGKAKAKKQYAEGLKNPKKNKVAQDYANKTLGKKKTVKRPKKASPMMSEAIRNRGKKGAMK